MPERVRQTDEVCAGAPLRVGPLAVVPIERMLLNAYQGDGCLWLSSTKEPYALIVRDAAGIRVLGVSAATMSLDALRELVPELDAMLATL